MHWADPIRGKQNTQYIRSRSWEMLSKRMWAFHKCASGSMSVEHVVWIPLFATVLLLSVQLSLTLHRYSTMWDWARDTGQRSEVVGQYSADIVNASQLRLEEDSAPSSQRW